MFSALRQGNIVYVLDKSNGLSLKTGRVVSNTAANAMYNVAPQMLLTIVIEIDGENKEFNNVPPMQSSVQYNNGTLIVIDDKDLANKEVEGIVNSSKEILANKDYYEKLIVDGEEVLKQLNPQFAKDKARDEEFNDLKNRVGGMETKLDTIITLLGKSEDK